MRVDILTLFPDLFTCFVKESILGRAIKNGLLDIRITNIRSFAKGPHKTVDDSPYGAEAIKAFARLFPEQYRFDRLLDDAATPAQVSAGVLQSLANLPSRKHMGIVLKHLDDRSLPVAMAAWETMPAVVTWSVKEPDAEISDVASRVERTA